MEPVQPRGETAMMKLKETLFGILTAVSLAAVAPYANASSYTCDDMIRVSELVATGNLNTDGLRRYARGVAREVKGFIPTLFHYYSSQDTKYDLRIMSQWWKQTWNDGNQDMLVLSVMNRVNLAQNRAKSLSNMSRGDSLKKCTAYGMGSYYGVSQF